jgi:hypothetical protein
VGQRGQYALGDLVLELNSEEPRRNEVDHLLQELSWTRVWSSVREANLHIYIDSNGRGSKVPPNCREVLRTDSFVGLEAGDEFYLTDGSSLFHLLPAKKKGYARLAPSFSLKPKLDQSNFWCFGLLKLLRPLGIFSLHAAGLVASDGSGLLLVGAPASGKSTLSIGLIREGWGYLSDDALLLRDCAQGVEALACRKSFYIDADKSVDYSDLSLGIETLDSNSRERRRVGITEAFAAQQVQRCVPRVVVFPRICGQDRSTLVPVDHVSALGGLLSQSAPQLFDRRTMGAQLELLKRLLQQCEIFELNAGIDLYHRPAKLIQLIAAARGETSWPALSLS